MVIFLLTLAAVPDVAILDMESGPGISADLAKSLNEKLVVALAETKRFGRVLASSDLRTVLSVDHTRQAYGCDTEDCYTQLGKSLDVDLVCLARLARTADRLSVDLKLVRMKSGQAAARMRREYLYETSLVADFAPSVRALASLAFGDGAPLTDSLKVDQKRRSLRQMSRYGGLGVGGLGLALVGVSNLMLNDAQAVYDGERNLINYEDLAGTAKQAQRVYGLGLVSMAGGAVLWWFNR